MVFTKPRAEVSPSAEFCSKVLQLRSHGQWGEGLRWHRLVAHPALPLDSSSGCNNRGNTHGNFPPSLLATFPVSSCSLMLMWFANLVTPPQGLSLWVVAQSFLKHV